MQNPDPLFGRPTWTYVDLMQGPVRGPQPRLAQGTGRTGLPAASGTGAQLPSYISDNQYEMTPFTYQPPARDSFGGGIPRSIGTGENGRQIVGTYQPYDFTPGQRFMHQMRSAPNWQIMAYPPIFRNIILRQQVQKYKIRSGTISAQPLSSNQYFLGYQVQPEIGSLIGQNALGYMGSV